MQHSQWHEHSAASRSAPPLLSRQLILFVSSESEACFPCVQLVGSRGLPVEMVRLDSEASRKAAASGPLFQIDSVPTLVVITRRRSESPQLNLYKGQDKVLQILSALIRSAQSIPPAPEPVVTEIPPSLPVRGAPQSRGSGGGSGGGGGLYGSMDQFVGMSGAMTAPGKVQTGLSQHELPSIAGFNNVMRGKQQQQPLPRTRTHASTEAPEAVEISFVDDNGEEVPSFGSSEIPSSSTDTNPLGHLQQRLSTDPRPDQPTSRRPIPGAQNLMTGAVAAPKKGMSDLKDIARDMERQRDNQLYDESKRPLYGI